MGKGGQLRDLPRRERIYVLMRDLRPGIEAYPWGLNGHDETRLLPKVRDHGHLVRVYHGYADRAAPRPVRKGRRVRADSQREAWVVSERQGPPVRFVHKDGMGRVQREEV